MEQRNVRQEFLEKGFVVLEGFFSEEELAEVERVMNQYLSLAEDQMADKGKEATPLL